MIETLRKNEKGTNQKIEGKRKILKSSLVGENGRKFVNRMSK